MDKTTERNLIALNNLFYAEHAASFSATRGYPWEGWESVVSLARQAGVPRRGQAANILDLACGNLRFERFFMEQPEVKGDHGEVAPLTFHAVDSCEALLPAAASADIRFHRVDILGELLDQSPQGASGTEGERPWRDIPPCDLSVCFGFMHHVPGAALRESVLRLLLDTTAPEGLIALSFWQFMTDERLARKALASDAVARERPPFPGFDPGQLETGDHFLGWQADPGPLRYCHSFTDTEIDELVAAVAPHARELARFSADACNRYVVMRA